MTLSSSAKAGDPVFREASVFHDLLVLLDPPLSRGMT